MIEPNVEFEVLVLGGGPAGLSAALYLGRYGRKTALFDVGRGRSTWHQITHNYLGFPGGVPARRLRELGYEQLADYPQVQLFQHQIETLKKTNKGFIAQGQAGYWFGQAVILCTGVVDHYPHFDGWEEYVGRSLFWCITCDGYNCRDQRVVVMGNTNDAAVEALQLTRFTDRITLLTDSHDYDIAKKFENRLHGAGIPIVRDRMERVEGQGGYVTAVITESGQSLACDQIFCYHGATPQTKLAQDVGVCLTEMGYIIVDTEQKTNVPGVYAAGDVTSLHSHQFSTAVHEGGQAASAANYFLYPPELKHE